MPFQKYIRLGRGVLKRRVVESTQRIGIGRPHIFVCEFPRSGGTWISNMIRDMVGHVPAADRDSPSAVLHTHVRHGSRLRPAVYVVRDGRDVVVSMYFFQVRHLRQRTPITGARAHRNFTYLFGPDYDAEDVKSNLPKYIENLSSRPLGVIVGRRRSSQFKPWPEHIRDWINRNGLVVVRYEDFLKAGAEQLGRVAEYLNVKVGEELLKEIVENHSFEKLTGRHAGDEDRSSFFRKGVAGDWIEYFTSDAAQAFQEFAGTLLIDLGYEDDNSWVTDLTV